MDIDFLDIFKEYSDEKDSQIVILPVPYDGTSTWIKGSDKGPTAILEASANLELYDIETDSEVYKKGIHTATVVSENKSPESMVAAVHERARYFLNSGKFLVTIGGEHSVSIGSIKAFADHYSDLTVLQLDAHSDLRPEYLGSKNNHACVMARIKEVAAIVQVGIRSMDISEKKEIDPERIFFAHEIKNRSDWQEPVLDLLSKNVYITIDLDVFDPAIMPSVGTPEPDGLQYSDVLELVKKVNERTNIVGFDVVELCPNDFNKAPDFMVAKLIYQILSFRFQTEIDHS
jgi:agmatinase